MNRLDENIENQDISSDIEEILLTNFKKDHKSLYPYLIVNNINAFHLNNIYIYI